MQSSKPRYDQSKKSGGKVIMRGNVILLDLKIILIASVLLSTLSMNIFCIVDRPTMYVPSEVMCQNEKISQRMTLQIVFVMTVRAFLPTASNNIHEKN